MAKKPIWRLLRGEHINTVTKRNINIYKGNYRL